MIVVNAKMTTNEENFKIIKKAVEKLEIETRKEKGCIDAQQRGKIYAIDTRGV